MLSHRRPLIAAVTFAFLLMVAGLLAPAPPGTTAPGGDVIAWATAHADAIRWQAWTVMLSSLPGGVLLALVHQRIHGPEATAYLVGGIVSVTILAVAMLLRLGLARHPTGLPATDARLLADVEAYWAPLLTFPIALQASALAFAARRGDLPGWLAPISLVLATEQLIETATVFGSHGAFAPGGTLNTLLGPVLYSVWLIAQGIAAQGRQHPPVPSPTAEPSRRNPAQARARSAA